jgi:SnoaL-like domain
MASETNPRHAALLKLVRDHMRDELRLQLEPVMATLVDDPEYHFHGMPGYDTLRGRAEVERYYRQMFAENRMSAEFVIKRIVVDNDTVITDGSMIALIEGATLVATNAGDIDGRKPDAASSYLASSPLLVVWPVAANALLIGEEIYLGAPRYKNLPGA